MYSCCGRFVKVEGLSKWKVCQSGRFVKVLRVLSPSLKVFGNCFTFRVLVSISRSFVFSVDQNCGLSQLF